MTVGTPEQQKRLRFGSNKGLLVLSWPIPNWMFWKGTLQDFNITCIFDVFVGDAAVAKPNLAADDGAVPYFGLRFAPAHKTYVEAVVDEFVLGLMASNPEQFETQDDDMEWIKEFLPAAVAAASTEDLSENVLPDEEGADDFESGDDSDGE